MPAPCPVALGRRHCGARWGGLAGCVCWHWQVEPAFDTGSLGASPNFDYSNLEAVGFNPVRASFRIRCNGDVLLDGSARVG